jgi:mRNA interferase HigB
MRVISNARLVEFAANESQASEPMQAWRKLMESSSFQHFAALRATFNTIDLAGEFHVFDIGGNKWRIVAFIHFPAQICYIKHVMTHKEYDKWKP